MPPARTPLAAYGPAANHPYGAAAAPWATPFVQPPPPITPPPGYGPTPPGGHPGYGYAPGTGPGWGAGRAAAAAGGIPGDPGPPAGYAPGPGGGGGNQQYLASVLFGLFRSTWAQIDLLIDAVKANGRGGAGGPPGGAGGPPGGGAAGAGQTAAKSAQAAAYAAAGTAGKLGLDNVAGTTSRLALFGQGLTDLGMARAGTALTRAAVPLAVAKAGIDAGAAVADYAYDRYRTPAQFGRQVVRALPAGEWLQSTVDRYTGRAAKMLEVDIAYERATARAGVEAEKRSFELSTQPGAAGERERAIGLARAQPVLMGPVDRSTAAGELDFQRRRATLGVERDIVAAQREAKVATAERVRVQELQTSLAAREVALVRQAADAEKRLQAGMGATGLTPGQKAGLILKPVLYGVTGMAIDNAVNEGVGSGPQRQQAIRDKDYALEQLQTVRAQQRAAAEMERAALNREATAKGQEGMLRGEQLKREAEFLEGRAGVVGGTARRLGRMSAPQRAQAEWAIQVLEQNKDNLDAIPREYIDMAESAEPQRVGMILEQYGAKTEMFKRRQPVNPLEYGQPGETPEGLRRASVEKADAAAKVQLKAEAEIARSASAAADKIAAAVTRGYDQLANEVEQKVLQKMHLRKNNE